MNASLRFRVVLSVIFLISLASIVHAQTPPRELDVPQGTALSGLGNAGFAFSSQTVWQANASGAAQTIWSAQLGINVIDAKSDNLTPGNRYVLQSDGTLYSYSEYGTTQSTPSLKGTVTLATQFESFKKLLVTPMEVLTSLHCYASNDGGQNWFPDTAGLGTAFNNDVAADSGQTLITATNSGLFTRAMSDNSWKKDTSWHQLNPSSIFVDRSRRIFVGVSAQGMFESTDHGATWARDSAGMGALSVSKINDDAFGNIYAVTNGGTGSSGGTRVYRSNNGGQSWSRIDGAMIPFYPEPVTATTFYNAGGDSVVYCSTVFGLFVSTDQGVSWKEHNAGMLAENVGTIEHVPGGRTMVTTDLGVFKRESGDTVWTRAYPQAGYLKLSLLYHDGANNFYLLGQHTTASNTATRVTYKSNDKGSTWIADTAGLYNVKRGGTFYVDETGVQHQMVSATQQAKGALIYVKPVGAAWGPDTSGFVSTGATDAPSAMISNMAGQLFLTGLFSGGNIWSRAIGGGPWALDTAGADTAQIYAMRREAGGAIVAAGRAGHFLVHSGSRWTKIGRPAGLDSSDAYLVSVDSTGAIAAAFRTVTGGFFTTQNGTYITRDNGVLWHYTGLQGYTISNLVSYGDTTYAMVAGRGAFRLTSTFHSAIQLSASDLSFGTVNIGEFADAPLSISNVGTDTLRITGMTADDSVFAFRNTTYTIAPGATVKDTVRFTPNAAGLALGNFSIVSNAPTSPTVGTLSGEGRLSSVQFSSRTFDFGVVRVGRTSYQTVTITNHGALPVIISQVTSSLSSYTASPASFTISAGAAFVDTIYFAPKSTIVANGVIVLASNSPSSPDTIHVTGSGKAPSLSVASRNIFCGTAAIGKQVSAVLNITNRGADTLNITSIGSSSGMFTVSQQMSIIPPGATAIDTIVFSPTALDTTHAVVVILSDAPTSPDTIAVRGVGTPALGVDEVLPMTLSLGNPYPNPAVDETAIPFSLVQSGRVVVTVFDELGRSVARLFDGELDAGTHEVRIHAGMLPANAVSGMYVVEFRTPSGSLTRRFMLAR